MELRQIKELMAAMGRTGTKRLKIKKENFELELEREDHQSASSEFAEQVAEAVKGNAFLNDIEQHRVNASPTRSDKRLMASDDHDYITEVQEEGEEVTSPMVGTFYLSPSPEDSPFVNVGDTVTPDMVICIIEAMKVMNEVKAGVSGTVAEILMDNGHPVEFGTKLFRIV